MIALVAWIAARTPLGLADVLSRLLAWVWWLVVPVRKRVAVDNLHACFPELEPGPTLRRTVSEMLLGYVELLQLDRVTLEWEGGELIQERKARGEGSLVLCGHGGSWDLVAAAIPRAQDLVVSMFVRRPSDPAVNDLIERLRVEHGLTLLPPDDSMPALYAALERGETVALALDQRRNSGIPVPFFGRPAWTSPGMAVAAGKTGTPVFGLWQWRLGVGHHRVRLVEIPTSGDVEEDTARMNQFYEDRIRERPHGWLWLHDRWRTP